MTIFEINDYILKKYKVKTLINLNFKNENQICFKNNKSEYPFCSLYLDICPNWGFAPGKILIHHARENKSHEGSSGAIIFKGKESIDWLMINFFEISKKQEEQTTIFDFI